MKKIFSLLMLTLVLFSTGCFDNKKEDVKPSYKTASNPTPDPLYCTVDATYDFKDHNTLHILRNNKIEFQDNSAYPYETVLIDINNTQTSTGTFTILAGQYNLHNSDQTNDTRGTNTQTPVGSVTITTNTDTYMEGSFTFTTEYNNPLSKKTEYKTYTGTFGGDKN